MIPSKGFACLMYHAIGEEANQYTVSEQQLRAQLSLLRAEAYVVDGFEQLETRLRSRLPLPTRYVVFTVDDGHESAIRVADILAEYRCQATFFLTRDRCLKMPDFIREPEIRELRRRGFSLGTHGITHRGLSFMPRERCIDELRGSKEWLEDVIGERVCYMTAPGGYINTRVIELAHEHRYVLVGTSNEWMNSPNTTTLLGRVDRVAIRRQFSTQDFRHIVEGYLGFYVWRQVRAAILTVPKLVLRR